MVDSGASMHMVSKTLTLLSRRPRSSTTVMIANGEVRTNEEATVHVKQLDLFVKVFASSRNSRSAFIGETLRRTWVHVSLEKRSESTSRQEWQED